MTRRKWTLLGGLPRDNEVTSTKRCTGPNGFRSGFYDAELPEPNRDQHVPNSTNLLCNFHEI